MDRAAQHSASHHVSFNFPATHSVHVDAISRYVESIAKWTALKSKAHSLPEHVFGRCVMSVIETVSLIHKWSAKYEKSPRRRNFDGGKKEAKEKREFSNSGQCFCAGECD